MDKTRATDGRIDWHHTDDGDLGEGIVVDNGRLTVHSIHAYSDIHWSDTCHVSLCQMVSGRAPGVI